MADDANTGVKEPVDVETTTTEAPTVENNTDTDNSNDDEFVLGFTGEADTPEEEEAQSEEDSEAEEADEPKEVEESEPTESEEKSNRAEERKQQLNTEIRDKVAERNALREEIAALSRKKFDLENEQALPEVESLVGQINPNTGDYYTRAEAENLRLNQRIDALEKQKAFEDYVERVADSRIQLSTEANQVIKDYPIFDPESDQYNPELTAAADEIMQSSLIVDDNTGQVIGSRLSPYQVYSAIAKAKASGDVAGKTSGRKAALDMMNNADVSSSAKAPSSNDEDDEFLAGFMNG